MRGQMNRGVVFQLSFSNNNCNNKSKKTSFSDIVERGRSQEFIC